MSAILDGKDGRARTALLVTLSDDEIVSRTYQLVGLIDDDEPYDLLSDDLYAVLTEAFERFAPMSEWRSCVASVAHMPPKQPRV